MTDRIIVADDHASFRESVRVAARRLERETTCVEAESVTAMLAALAANPGAALLLLDVNMPGACGFNALAFLRGCHPGLPVIAVSADDDPQTVGAALALGARGFLPKSTEMGQFGRALEAVLDGGTCAPPGFVASTPSVVSSADLDIADRVGRLTPQEFRALGTICAGLPDSAIADELDVTVATAELLVAAVLRKLGVASRTEVVLGARRLAVDRASVKGSET
jgi:DNA-binding NarL/FixJ family response regulator